MLAGCDTTAAQVQASSPAAASTRLQAWFLRPKPDPHRPAIIVSPPGHVISHETLLHAINALASQLRRLRGVGGRNVAIAIRSVPEMAVASLAVLAAGGTVVLLDPLLKRQEAQRLLAAADASLLLRTAAVEGIEMDAACTELALPVCAVAFDYGTGEVSLLPRGRCLVGSNDDGACQWPQGGPATEGDTAIVMATSATTTGKSKLVRRSHSAYMHSLLATYKFTNEDHNDSFVLAQPTYLSGGASKIMRRVGAGSCIICQPRGEFDVGEYWKAAHKYAVTFVQATPPRLLELVRFAVQSNIRPPQTLRHVRGGATAMPVEVQKELQAFFGEVPVLQHYAASESGAVCSQRFDGVKKLGSVGPVINSSVRLAIFPLGSMADAGAAPVPVRNGYRSLAGEVCVQSPTLFSGYYGDEEATKRAFVARYYRTGDIGYVDEDGHLFLTGRVKELINRGGEKVSPFLVEEAVLRHPAVAEAVAFPLPHELLNEEVAVAIVAKAGHVAPSSSELGEFLSRHLPQQAMPHAVVACDAIPRDERSTKVSRAGLAKALGLRTAKAATSEQPATGSTPATPIESDLRPLWRDVLGLPALPSGTDDFLLLGGGSNAAARLSTLTTRRLREAGHLPPGRSITPGTILHHRTIGALAQHVLHGGTPGFSNELARFVDAAAGVPASFEVPVSSFQRAFLLQQLLHPDVDHHNVHAQQLRLGMQCDEAAVRAALQALVRKHDVLRTHFALGMSRTPPSFYSVVLNQDAFWVPLQVHADLSTTRAEVNAAIRKSFALLEEPPVRAVLFLGDAAAADVESGEGVGAQLFLVLHHICTDYQSSGMLCSDLHQLLAAAAIGRPLPKPSGSRVQYVDFSIWQSARHAALGIDEQVEWWRQKLRHASAELSLPVDRSHVGGPPSAASGVEPWCVPTPVAEALRSACRAAGATTVCGLLSIFTSVLARWGQQQLTVGVPHSHRHLDPQLQQVVGPFAIVLPVPLRLSLDDSLLDAARRAAAELRQAMEHSDVPYDQLVRAAGGGSPTARSPLFRVMLQLLPASRAAKAEARGPATVGRDADDDDETARRAPRLVPRLRQMLVDLELALREYPDGSIRGDLVYDAHLYGEIAPQLMHQLSRLLEWAVSRPQQPLSHCSLVDNAERLRLIAGIGAGPAVHRRPTCFHRLFDEQALRTPEAIAVECDPVCTTYRKLRELSIGVAMTLRQRGMQGNFLAALLTPRGLPFITGMLGILMAGGGFVPVDPAYPAVRVSWILHEVAPGPVLLSEAPESSRWAAAEAVAHSGCTTVWIERVPSPDRLALPLPQSDDASSIAYVIYTSGTTGKPKGVVVEHRSAVDVGQTYIERYRVSPSDRVFQFYSPLFDLSILDYMLALFTGARLLLWEGQWLDALKRSSATILGTTPSALATLPSSPTPSIANCRLILLCGEPLPLRVAQVWSSGPAVLLNSYGPTEATICATSHKVSPDDHCVPIGSPLPNYICRVLDAALQLQPIGVPGELYVGGVGVAREYLSRPELTAERFVRDRYGAGRLYRTGDIVRWAENGELLFHGRVDAQVKLRGVRLELAEIEAAAREADPQLRDACAVVVTSGIAQRLLLFVSPMTVDRKRLLDELPQRLPGHAVPNAIEILAELPRNANDKLDRAALALRASASSAAAIHPEAKPADVDVGALSAVREELKAALDLPELPAGVASLAEMGVHSLAAIILSRRLADRMQRHVEARRILECGSVSALARMLAEEEATSAPDASEIEHDTAGATAMRKTQPRRATGTRPRLLMLHGHAGSAAVMASLLEITEWQRRLGELVELVCIDAPNMCSPEPELYRSLCTLGLYPPSSPCWSWGRGDAKRMGESIAFVEAFLSSSRPPIDGIAGMCDGAAIAAAVAARQPQLQCLISISPRSDRVLQGEPVVRVPSVHLWGEQEQEPKLGVFHHCAEATAFSHRGGHSIPFMFPAFERKLSSLLLSSDAIATSDCSEDESGSDDESCRDDESVSDEEESSPTGNANHREPFDSMQAVIQLQHADEAEREMAYITMHAYAVAATFVMFQHSRWSLLRYQPSRTHFFEDEAEAVRAISPWIAFALLAGSWDSRQKLSRRRLERIVTINGSMYFVLCCTYIPEWMSAASLELLLWLGYNEPRPHFFQRGLVHRMRAPAWFLIAITVFRLLQFIGQHARLKRWVLPTLAIAAHFGSYGSVLPWPLQRWPLNRHYSGVTKELARRFPAVQPPAGLVNLFMYYALPSLLPQDFPRVLPFQNSMFLRSPALARLGWVATQTALLLSIPQEKSDYATVPYACVNTFASKPSNAATRCIGIVTSVEPRAAQWSSVAFGWDVVIFVRNVASVIGICACVPRQFVPLLSKTGASALVVFALHIVVSPLTDHVGGKLLGRLFFGTGYKVMPVVLALLYSFLCARVLALVAAVAPTRLSRLVERFSWSAVATDYQHEYFPVSAVSQKSSKPRSTARARVPRFVTLLVRLRWIGAMLLAFCLYHPAIAPLCWRRMSGNGGCAGEVMIVLLPEHGIVPNNATPAPFDA